MSESPTYLLEATDLGSRARVGRLHTAHGIVETPVFMPVGTRAAVKGIGPAELRTLNAQIILANAYHLYLRPGADIVARAGGLHAFMGWDGPLLTDSGGFQIFSLRDTLELDDDGVSFKSILDGSKHRWTPETNMQIQGQLGADIIMQLDECAPYPATRVQAKAAVERSASWAGRCLAYHSQHGRASQGLFAIVQGSVYADLRLESVEKLLAIDAEARAGAGTSAAAQAGVEKWPGAAAAGSAKAGGGVENSAAAAGSAAQRGLAGFAGFAIGGYSVGEPHAEMFETLGSVTAALPNDRPRYLMGVGNPTSLLKAIALGVDMFDCVLPTRTARMGTAFSSSGRLNLRNARFKEDYSALDPACNCPTCQGHSRAYLRHLFAAKEMLGPILLSVHNLHYLINLIEQAQQAIRAGSYAQFLRNWLDSPAAADY